MIDNDIKNEAKQKLFLLKHFPTEQLDQPGVYDLYYDLCKLLEMDLRDLGVVVGTEEGHDEEVEMAGDTIFNVSYDRQLNDHLNEMCQRNPQEFRDWFRANGG
jgi:hypothetical protein